MSAVQNHLKVILELGNNSKENILGTLLFSMSEVLYFHYLQDIPHFLSEFVSSSDLTTIFSDSERS
jgi:hypothetical protein